MSYERAIRLMDAARDSALERLDYLANRIRGESKASGGWTDYGLDTKTHSQR